VRAAPLRRRRRAYYLLPPPASVSSSVILHWLQRNTTVVASAEVVAAQVPPSVGPAASGPASETGLTWRNRAPSPVPLGLRAPGLRGTYLAKK